MSTGSQDELIPRPEDDGEEEAELARLTTAQLLMKFPDLAPPKFVPEECRKMDESKRYNGQRFKRDHPEAYKWVIKCLAANVGYREIERMGGPKYYVVKAIGFEEGIAIKEQKRHLSNIYAIGSEVYAEKAIELADTVKSGKDAAIAGAIMADKHLQFSGEAAVRIEISGTVNVQSRMDGLYAKIQDKFEEMKRVSARVVDPEALPE
jgi:hypothetical protein